MPGTRGNPIDKAWFQNMFGFKERDYAETKSKLEVVGEYMNCKANEKEFHIGHFEVPALELLRLKCEQACATADDKFWAAGSLSFKNIVACTRALHLEPTNANSVFQVMALYNCLETTKKGQGPEAGVQDYAEMPCQGPVAMMACPAATVYRNYFATEVGARCDVEIDCLDKLAQFVNNKENKYWTMLRGFCMPVFDGSLAKFSKIIANDPEFERQVEERVQVGVHWSTEVAGGKHDVTQVICSALPVAYFKATQMKTVQTDWEGFATALLEASYDATLTVATMLAAERGARVKVFLTVLGGGELGNRPKWISAALNKALHTHEKEPLDVFLVHHAEIPGFYSMLEEGRDKGLAGATLSQTMQLQSIKSSEDFKAVEGEIGDAADEVSKAFAHFDTNGDGVIDRVEMMKILQGIDDDFFTEHVVNILFKEADCDGDGQVHYKEFVNWMCSEDEDITFAVLDRVANCPSSPNAPKPH